MGLSISGIRLSDVFMRFLLPLGGVVDRRFGIMTTPGHKNIPLGIKEGMDWAADNQAFNNKFDPARFFSWLETMLPYRATCLFITVPDKWGDAHETRRLFEIWRGWFSGWPIAFAAQDGQHHMPFPDGEWAALFLGGSNNWMESVDAIQTIKRAQALGKHIHIGRVNWARRYKLYAQIRGSERFTCDGTRTRFDGSQNAIQAWLKYQEETNVLQIW